MEVEGVVFDMDGVLRIGSKIVNGAENILETLSKRGIKTMIVTNECRYSVSELKEELHELGLLVPKNCQFYTAALSAKDYLEKKITRFPEEKFRITVVGELGLYSAISKLSRYNNFRLEEEYEDYMENDRKYIIVGTVNKIKFGHLNKILEWYRNGAKIITTCVDTTDPSSKGDFNLGMPKHMLHMVDYNIKTKSYSTGKPHPIHKEKIMKCMEINDENKVMFIGDTIYSDIRLAEESGFRSCLVLTGNSSRDTLKSYVTEPDHVINNLDELKEILSLN